MAELPAERRDALLADARRIAQHCERRCPGASRQAAAALVILRQHGVDGLRRALDRDLPAGAAAPAWSAFRQVLHAYLDKGPWQTPAGLAFTLGWARRLGAVEAAGADA